MVGQDSNNRVTRFLDIFGELFISVLAVIGIFLAIWHMPILMLVIGFLAVVSYLILKSEEKNEKAKGSTPRG